MSNIDDETVGCNCSQHLHVNNVNIVHGEINNNNISIDTTERTNNNTVIIICDTNFDSNKNEPYCEKAVQTDSDLEASPNKSVDKIENMDKDRSDSNNFPLRNNVNNSSKFKNIETNDNEIVTIEEYQTMYSEFNTRSNNENNIARRAGRNVTENKCTRPQNLSICDPRNMDKSMPDNIPIFDSSQITKLLNHSDRNKAVINNILANYMSTVSKKSSQSKLMDTFAGISPSNKLALKQILDKIHKESQDAEIIEEKKVHAFTQTEDVQNVHEVTQTDSEIANAYYNNSTTELNCVALKEFLRESKIYFEEFQNKLQYLFLQYTIQNNNQNDKLHNQITFCDEGANTSTSGTNDKVDDAAVNNDNAGLDNNVSNRGMAVDIENLASNINNPRHVGTIGNGGHARNRANNVVVTDCNNNDKAYNTVNPMPRQGPMLQGEQTPVMQPGFSGNHPAQTRAGRPRNEMSNLRFSPYSRQQFWHQEFNNRQRQSHPLECPNVSGMQIQHNSMLRQFNGWQVPNPPNPPNHQSLFNPHHHHHHF